MGVERQRPAPQFGGGRALLAAIASCLLAVLSGCVDEGPYTHDLAAELMSPYCPGRTVSSCPSPQASELVQWIQVQEAAGASRDEVVEMLIERFGDDILAAPPAEGITLWAYVFPVAGFLGGGGLAAWVLRRIVGGRDDDDDDESDPPGGEAPSSTGRDRSGTAEEDEFARLVDEELSQRR